MNEDPRCCGSGNCIIDAEGRCWCGRQWDVQGICNARLTQAAAQSPAEVAEPPRPPAVGGA